MAQILTQDGGVPPVASSTDGDILNGSQVQVTTAADSTEQTLSVPPTDPAQTGQPSSIDLQASTLLETTAADGATQSITTLAGTPTLTTAAAGTVHTIVPPSEGKQTEAQTASVDPQSGTPTVTTAADGSVHIVPGGIGSPSVFTGAGGVVRTAAESPVETGAENGGQLDGSLNGMPTVTESVDGSDATGAVPSFAVSTDEQGRPISSTETGLPSRTENAAEPSASAEPTVAPPNVSISPISTDATLPTTVLSTEQSGEVPVATIAQSSTDDIGATGRGQPTPTEQGVGEGVPVSATTAAAGSVQTGQATELSQSSQTGEGAAQTFVGEDGLPTAQQGSDLSVASTEPPYSGTPTSALPADIGSVGGSPTGVSDIGASATSAQPISQLDINGSPISQSIGADGMPTPVQPASITQTDGAVMPTPGIEGQSSVEPAGETTQTGSGASPVVTSSTNTSASVTPAAPTDQTPGSALETEIGITSQQSDEAASASQELGGAAGAAQATSSSPPADGAAITTSTDNLPSPFDQSLSASPSTSLHSSTLQPTSTSNLDIPSDLPQNLQDGVVTDINGIDTPQTTATSSDVQVPATLETSSASTEVASSQCLICLRCWI